MTEQKRELSAADLLAAERTRLANERTLLSFVRTGIALAASGATMAYLLTTPAGATLGSALIVLGVLVVGFGAFHYRGVRRHIARIMGQRE
ncbi:MAG: putative membrane protein [Bradymonadia bacterium]